MMSYGFFQNLCPPAEPQSIQVAVLQGAMLSDGGEPAMGLAMPIAQAMRHNNWPMNFARTSVPQSVSTPALEAA